MDNITKNIVALGLDKNEATIYMYLIRLGEMPASRISQGTNITRPTVYRILDGLVIKGLVDEIATSGRKQYRAHNPKQFAQLLKEKERDLERQQEVLAHVSDKLDDLFSTYHGDSRAVFYEGDNAVVSVFRDQINESNYEKLVISSVTKTLESFPEGFAEMYLRSKQSQNITTRVIAQDTQEDRDRLAAAYSVVSKKKYHPRVRFISKDKFSHATDINIYGQDKIAALNYRKEKPIAIIIQDQALHDMMQMMFEIIWESLPENNFSTYKK